MLVNERKKRFDEFYEWVRKDWTFNIPGTTFEKELTGLKGSFRSYVIAGLKDQGVLDKELEANDFVSVLSHFVAWQINGGKEGYKSWIVESTDISNAYINYVKGRRMELYIFLKEETAPGVSKLYKGIFESAITNYNVSKLKELGLTNKIRKEVEEARETEDVNFSEKIKVYVYRLSRNDHPTEESEDGIPLISFPEFFTLLHYKRFESVKDNDNQFTITDKIGDTNTKVLIDIKTNDNYVTKDRKADQIFIAPINVLELLYFIKGVYTKRESVDSLFTLNVRDRKNKNKVSDGVFDSLMEAPENFLMLNNGITTIVDSVSADVIGGVHKINLKNIQIINGQQTSFTLFDKWLTATDSAREGIVAQYEKAYVLMKAYVVNGDHSDRHKFYTKIANASNSQTAIKSKDLMSTRTFNMTLKEELLKLGINYSFRDGKSDFTTQFKDLPKTNLNDLVKMHYISLTNEVWKRSGIGAVFDTLTGMSKPQKANALSKYKDLFNEKKDEELSKELISISKWQLYYKGQKDLLKTENQGLDALIYFAILLEKHGLNGKVNIDNFISIANKVAGNADRNNFYKSKTQLSKLMISLLENYSLQNTDEYRFFKETLQN